MICYAKGLTEGFKTGIVKLLAVISDDGMRDSKSINDVSFNEVCCLLFSNCCQRLRFDPLSEVVYSDNTKLLVRLFL